MEIQNCDIVTIGISKMMLVGLCGSHFDWNGGKDNEQGADFSVPRLMKMTGLSRGFFYKNPEVRSGRIRT